LTGVDKYEHWLRDVIHWCSKHMGMFTKDTPREWTVHIGNPLLVKKKDFKVVAKFEKKNLLMLIKIRTKWGYGNKSLIRHFRKAIT
jgi:hypothetical protein